MQTCNINGIQIGKSHPVLMGVLNLSPESFFSGSYVPPDKVRNSAIRMIEDGADIIDIGARSTAPGSKTISVQEEKERVIQALSAIEGLDITISLDTMHPEVLLAALRYSIHTINDISGLINPKMASIISDTSLPPILMVSQKQPGDCLTFSDTCNAIDLLISRCKTAEIPEYILDPGIGHWIPERTDKADWELCRKFSHLTSYHRPLLAAVSRKSFIGAAIGRPAHERLAGTLAVTASLLTKGASIVRCHDISETRDIIRIHNILQEIA